MKSLLKLTLKLVSIALFIGSGLFALAYPILGPRYVDLAIRKVSSDQIFKVYGFIDKKTGMAIVGTGSIIRVPGTKKTYLITNRHVCEENPDGNVIVEQGSFKQTLKIIKMSKTTDLCAVETIPGFTGLEMVKEYHSGDEIMAIGHPTGYPTTKTTGEIVGHEDVVVGSKITTPKQEANCLFGSNSKIVERPADSDQEDNSTNEFTYVSKKDDSKGETKKDRYCITLEPRSILATAQVMPGSSGSPLLTWYGEVVGIVFATDETDSWARVIPLERLKKFLKEL